jgi:hypothetical protein
MNASRRNLLFGRSNQSPNNSQPPTTKPEPTTLSRRQVVGAGIAAAVATLSGCGPTTERSYPYASSSANAPKAPAAPKASSFIIASQAPQEAEYGAIFGFNTLADVSSPGAEVQQQIIEQLKRGNRRVPIYMLGNVTEDGLDIGLNSASGVQKVSNDAFKPLLTMLDNIEKAGNLPSGFIRLTPYLRLSVTEEDRDPKTNPNSPGKVDLSNPTIKANVQTLIKEIASTNRFGISDRVSTESASPLSGYPSMGGGIVIDAEDILDPDFDRDDLQDPNDHNSASSSNIADLIQGLGQKDFEVFVYNLGILNKDWFPKSTGPFASSPRNFLSITAAKEIISAGGKLAIALYERFPDPQLHNAGKNVSDPAVVAQYGPYHPTYVSFVTDQLKRLIDAGINIEEQRFLLPAFKGSALIPSAVEAINAFETAKAQVAATRKLVAEVFEASNLLNRPPQQIAGDPAALKLMADKTR